MDVLRRSARNSRMERIKKRTYKGNNGSEREAGHHRHHREEKTEMVWPSEKDARRENNKINCEIYTKERRKRRRPRKMWMEGVQAAMTTRNLEPHQWRSREEWCLVSGRRRQLLNKQDRQIVWNKLAFVIHLNRKFTILN